MKKILIFILTLITIFLVSNTKTYAEDKYTIYIRQGCAHCAKVEAFVSKNKLEGYINYKETYNNEANQKELDSAFAKYKAAESEMGVPFMIVSETEYLVGDQPIIDFLAKKYNITDTTTTSEYQTSTSDTVFLAVGGLAVLAIFGYGLYSAIKKK